MPNSSFEKEQNGEILGWNGACKVRSGLSKSGRNSLELRAGQVCKSEPFPIFASGHYSGKAWIFGEGLNPRSDLGGFFRIELKVFDAAGNPIPVDVPFLSEYRDASLLSARLNMMATFFLLGFQRFTEISLIAGHYPLDAGWMPKHAHSAHVEVSYAGPGSLFLDDISFYSTKWNLSLRKRVEAFAGQPYPVFPPPRFMSNDNQVLSPDALANIETVIGLPCEELHSNQKELCNRARSSTEGYVLRAREGKIQLCLSSERASTYARNTLSQLLRSWKDDTSPAVPLIIDFPAVDLRANTGNFPTNSDSSAAHGINWLNESRINTVFLNGDGYSSKWWSPSLGILNSADHLSRAKEHGSPIDVGVMINPYSSAIDNTAQFPFEASDPQTFDRLRSSVKVLHRFGVTKFVLRTDDLVPARPNAPFGYHLSSNNDRRSFGTLARLHTQLLNDLASSLRDSPENKVLFVPPWYNWWFITREPDDALRYSAELANGLGSEVPLVWTGPTVRSLFMDEIEVARFKKAVGTDNLVLWDNSTFARWHKDFWRDRPERERYASFFEPYDVQMPTDSYGVPVAGKGVMLFFEFLERSRPKLATAGAYWWNPADYQPERAVYTFLLNLFGQAGTMALLEFDECYWKEKGDWHGYSKTERSKRKTLLFEILDRAVSEGTVEIRPLVAEFRHTVSLLPD